MDDRDKASPQPTDANSAKSVDAADIHSAGGEEEQRPVQTGLPRPPEADSDEPATPEWVLELRSRLPQLDDLAAMEVDDSRFFVAGRKSKASSQQRAELNEALAVELAGMGIVGYPAIYDAKEWARLNEITGTGGKRPFPGAAGPLMADATALHETLAHYHRCHPFPRETRRLLLRIVRDHEQVIEFLEGSAPFPVHVSLSLAAKVVTEALDLMLATKGGHFSLDTTSLAALRAELGAERTLARQGIVALLRLEGLSRRAALEYRLAGRDGDPDLSTEKAFQSAARFLRELGLHFREQFSTDAERQRRRIVRRLAWAGAALAGLALVIIYLVATRPIEPLTKAASITQPGGIAATYYGDENLRTKVVTRTDPVISMHTRGSPVSGIPKDKFSIRWRGYTFFPEKDKYTLCIESDDGSRLIFNERLLIDNWGAHGTRRRCEAVRVRSGWYPLTIEYFDTAATAHMAFLRGLEEDDVRRVPASHLCCKLSREPPPPEPAVAPRAPAPPATQPGAASGPAAQGPPADRGPRSSRLAN